MNVKQRKDWLIGNEAAKPYGTRNAQRPFPMRDFIVYRSTAQTSVGEIPLNGKGVPQTGKAEGEEMVYSHMKI